MVFVCFTFLKSFGVIDGRLISRIIHAIPLGFGFVAFNGNSEKATFTAKIAVVKVIKSRIASVVVLVIDGPAT